MPSFYRYVLTTLLLFSCFACFGLDVGAMQQDKSIELLQLIFGQLNNIIEGGDPADLLPQIFQHFNIFLTTIGSIILTYTTFVSTLNTAQEGKPMGKKWGNLWTPLRSILGMILMVPTPATGYSLIQMFLMWLVLQGTNITNNLWAISLDNLQNNHSSLSSPSLEVTDKQRLLTQGAQTFDNILHSAVCATAFARNGITIDLHSYKHFTINAASQTVQIGTQTYRNLCGEYTLLAEVTDLENKDLTPESITEILDKQLHIKYQALAAMYDNALLLASEIVENKLNPCNSSGYLLAQQPNHGGQLKKQQHLYQQKLHELNYNYPTSIWLAELFSQGKDHGWITAGGTHLLLNYKNKLNLFKATFKAPQVKHIPRWDEPRRPQPQEKLNDYLIYSNNNLQAEYNIPIKLHVWLYNTSMYIQNDKIPYLDTSNNNKDIYPFEFPHNYFSELNAHNISTYSEWLKSFQDKAIYFIQHNIIPLDKKVDPITQLSQLGKMILHFCEGGISYIIKNGIVLFNQHISREELRKKGDSLLFQGVALSSLLGILWLAGATLALYVPLIPYLIYTIATIGWLIQVIEAMIGSGIMALGCILPSNDELGKIIPGLTIVLNLIMRPTLMLIGYFLASRLYIAVIYLVHSNIGKTLHLLDMQGSLFAWIPAIIMYVFFIVALINKCFALIYQIPDKILRWIGSGPEQTDVNQELQQVKSGLQRASDATYKPIQGFATAKLYNLEHRLNASSIPAPPPPPDPGIVAGP